MSVNNSDFTGAFKSDKIAEIMDRRRALSANQEWVVDKIFPAGAMHLIGGPSGVGKTTWLFQMLHEWEQSQPLFGEYASHPMPWVYISCDRSMREMQQTLVRLGYENWSFESYALEELIWDQQLKKCKDPNFTDHILHKFPHAKLVVLEGLQAVMPDKDKNRSQNKAELIWAMEQRHILSEKNRTVIATTHNPKVQQLVANVDERSKFLGSQGFIGSCSTMIGFEKGSNPEDRNVTIMGRNFADIKLGYTQSKENSGRFVLHGNDGRVIHTEEDDFIAFMTWCQLQSDPFTVKQATEYLMLLKVSLATVNRWLDRLVVEGTLERFKDPQDARRFLYRPLSRK